MRTRILSLLLLAGPLALAGPRTDGGGNSLGSTPEQVREAIKTAPDRLYYFLVNSMQFNTSKISDPQLKAAWQNLFEQKKTENRSNIVQLLEDKLVKIEIKENGSCQGEEGHVDASTEYKIGAKICMSVPRLMRMSYISLHEELMSLLVHELTHQFGYDEATAQKTQTYFRGMVRITTKLSSTQCLTPSPFDGVDYEEATQKARRAPKNSILSGSGRSDRADFKIEENEKNLLSFATYRDWILFELNNDSLMTQQIGKTLYDLSSRPNTEFLEDYINAKGIVCQRFYFNAEQLKVESIRAIESSNKESKMIEVKFAVLLKHKTLAEHFVMQIFLEYEDGYWGVANRTQLQVYPQFIAETKNEN